MVKFVPAVNVLTSESEDAELPVIVQILSGYRTHKTNEMLRRKSSLVAKDSYHIKGKALDFRLPNVGLQQIKRSAQDHASGGLGIYQNFSCTLPRSISH